MWRVETWERSRRKAYNACSRRFCQASYRMFTWRDCRGDRSQLQLWLPLTCDRVRSVSYELDMFSSCDCPCNCRTDYTNWSHSHWPAKWCDTWNVEQTLKLTETVKNCPILWQTDQKNTGLFLPRRPLVETSIFAIRGNAEFLRNAEGDKG